MTRPEPRSLHLSFTIPEVFSTPDERHQYGDMMANYLKSALRIMGTRTPVSYTITTPTGESEGPDGGKSQLLVTARNES